MALGGDSGAAGGAAALEAPSLEPALAGYCEAEGGEEEAAGHLNGALLYVQRTKRFEDLVAHMGPYLTSEDGRVRTKAMTLLGEVLSRMPSLPLGAAATHHYIEFFTSRLSDFPSLGGSLLGLRALLQHHPMHARQGLEVIARATFKHVHVPSLGQGLRQRAFEVLFEMLSPSDPHLQDRPVAPAILEMQTEFLRGFLDCMEGEKDPRCLILCLKSLSRMQSAMPASADEYAEGVFDVTACYFPITFTPPPNDPYGITPDMLSSALRDVLTGRPAMAEYVLPLLVDKLSSTHVPAKLEALATLQAAARRYGPKALRRNLLGMTSSIYQEVVNCPEAVVVTAALDTARVLAAQLSGPHPDSGGDGEAGDWEVLCKNLVNKGVDEIRRGPNSLMSRACVRLLGAVARASAKAYSSVLKAAMPVALGLLQPTQCDDADHHHHHDHGNSTQAALELLVHLIEAVDPLVDFSATRDGPPLAPFAESLRAALMPTLSGPCPIEACLGTQGLCSLATRSPSPLLPLDDVKALVEALANRLKEPRRDPEVSQATLAGLQLITKRRPEYTSLILGHTLPDLLRWLGEAHGADLDRCLDALAQLSAQVEIFAAVVPALVGHVLASGSGYAHLKATPSTAKVLASLAKILASHGPAHRAALPAMLALEEGNMQVEDPWLWSLLVALLSAGGCLGGSQGAMEAPGVLEAGMGILSAVTEPLQGPLQDALVRRLLSYFVHASEEAPEPPLPGLDPLERQAYATQFKCVSLLNAALAALDVSSALFTSDLLIKQLLPSLVGLALAASGSPAFLPACQGAAVLLNKLPSEAAVEATVKGWLEGIKAAGAVSEPNGRLAEAEGNATGLAWLTKALAMRGSPKQPLADALGLLLDLVETSTSTSTTDESRLALALHAAVQLGMVMSSASAPGPTPLLSLRARTTRVNPLWRQRMFYMAYPRLRAEVDRRREQPEAQAPALMVICHMVSELPRPVLQSELEGLVTVVIQAMSSHNAALSSRALESFACMTRESVEAVVPHLSTLVPLLLSLVTPGSGVYLEKARLRVLALESLLQLSRLSYAKVHPHRAQVTRGLLAPLDDRKSAVRAMAVRARNEWMVWQSTS